MKANIDLPAAAGGVWKGATWLLGAVLTCGAAYASLWMDARNDKRYVQIEAYNQDRLRDKELRDVKERAMDKKLDEISNNVNTLLQEFRTGERNRR